MIETYIDEIIEKGTPEQMHKMKRVFEGVIDELDDKARNLAEYELHNILYGNHIGQPLAKEWVACMENKDGTKGEHWSFEQTETVRKQYATEIDASDFYTVLNMVYSDYYNSKFDTTIYVQLAKDWLEDSDVGERKLVKYYFFVVK